MSEVYYENSLGLDKIKSMLCKSCKELLENGDDRDLPYSFCRECFLKYMSGDFGVRYVY